MKNKVLDDVLAAIVVVAVPVAMYHLLIFMLCR
jgi:hypothetical protein